MVEDSILSLNPKNKIKYLLTNRKEKKLFTIIQAIIMTGIAVCYGGGGDSGGGDSSTHSQSCKQMLVELEKTKLKLHTSDHDRAYTRSPLSSPWCQWWLVQSLSWYKLIVG